MSYALARTKACLTQVKVKGLTSTLDTLRMIVGKRWPVMAILFALELVAIVGVSNSAFFPSELTFYENQYNSTAAVLNQSAVGQVGGIFANNFKVTIFELIPALGLAIFGLSLYETARIVEAIAVIKGVSVGLALGNLFLLPSTWLELPAYAIAATEGLYLIYAIYLGFKSGWAKFVKETRFLMVNLILIAGVLAVAAVFEVSEIQIAGSSPDGPIYALLTWIPFAPIFAGVVVFWRRARKALPELEAREAAEMAPDAGASQGFGERGRPPQQSEKDSAGSPTSSPYG